MNRPVFTTHALRRVMRPRDRIRFGVDLKTGRDLLLEEALEYAETPPTSAPPFRIVQARGKDCVSYQDYSVHLTHRTIARYISRRFRVYPLSRSVIVQSVLEALSDATPMWVIRRDIKSFYETVPTTLIKARLLSNTAIPRIVRSHLATLLNTHSPTDRGLPRGVGLAALLSEMAMNDFDQAIKGFAGVYRYFRFADDILIFSFKEPHALIEALEAQISALGMRFNRGKSDVIEITNESKKSSISKSFDYLGYEFAFDDKCFTDKPRRVHVSIAKRKISKLKSRIIRSFMAFAVDRNYRLLYDRIRYLSANYTVSVTKSATGRTGAARAGIYYSYPQCGVYRGIKTEEHGCAEIKAVDGFYHSLLKGPSSRYRSLLAAELTPAELQALSKISFFKGYISRYLLSLSSSRIGRIQEAWRHVR